MKRTSFITFFAAMLGLAACNRNDADPAEAAAALARDLGEAATRLRNHKSADAEKIYLRILEKDPEQPAALAGMAEVRMSEKDWNSAQVLLERSIQARGDVARVHFVLGEVFRRTQRHVEAAESYARAFELESDNSEYGLSYGIALKNSGQLPAAETVLRRVAELDPMAQFVFSELGDVLREQNKLEEALKTYMKAQNTYASDKAARAGAALVYEAQGDIVHALDEWSSYIRMDCCSDYSNDVAKKKVMELKATSPHANG